MNPAARPHHARQGREKARRRARRLALRVARRRRAQRRGAAFIMVLGALTIMTVMLTELQDESSAELAGALQARDAVIAEYAARSGTNLSRLLLAAEPTIRKSLGMLSMLYGGSLPQIPVWDFSDRVLGAFNDAQGSQDFASFSGLDLSAGKNLGLPGAAFELKIVDEDSKINANVRASEFSKVRLVAQLSSLLYGQQYDPLFERKDSDGNYSDRQSICSALIDWSDPDQETQLCDPAAQTAQQMPAEDSYYELLDPPYPRKNAPFDSLDELRRVRGFGEDFWATFVDPDPDKPEKRTMTVWGSAEGVNVNTAAPQTLLALVCSNAMNTPPRLCTDPLEAQKFLTLVTLARGFTMGAPPFSSPKVFINVLKGTGKSPIAALAKAAGLEPVVFDSEENAMKAMTTESKVFSIYAIGVVRAGKRESRVRTQTVVDFRGAPAPGQGTEDRDPTQNPDPQTPAGSASGTGADTDSGTALKRAVEASPAGNVVYFRID
jgi:general secretion pathway protein K